MVRNGAMFENLLHPLAASGSLQHVSMLQGAKAYGALIDLLATIGALIAARHVWLQHLPPEEAPRCGPGLDYMLQTMPLNETLREVLIGSGECAEVDWTLLGFSIPEWKLLLFIGLGVVGVVSNWRLRR